MGCGEEEGGMAALMGLVQSHETLGAYRVYIDPAALRSATSFDQSENFNKYEKILISCLMSSDHSK